MCEKCYTYIYDLLIDPLDNDHILYGFINDKSLRTCSYDIANIVEKCLKKYMSDENIINCFKLLRKTYEENQTLLRYLNDGYLHSKYMTYEYDKYIWEKFRDIFTSEYGELQHAIQVCMDNSVVRKVTNKEAYLEHYFMYKLHILIKNLPDIHKDHSEKRCYEVSKSLGPVPQWKIDMLRNNANIKINLIVQKEYTDHDLYN